MMVTSRASLARSTFALLHSCGLHCLDAGRSDALADATVGPLGSVLRDVIVGVCRAGRPNRHRHLSSAGPAYHASQEQAG
jgi:hypothetical protein